MAEAVARVGSPLCVGLDPDFERLPPAVSAGATELDAIEQFCMGVIEAAASVAPIVKPQSACFERYGSAGVAVLERVCREARARGQIILLDAKRGDIGQSGRHYAQAALRLGAHAITVSGYLGPDTIEPFVSAGLGVFVLVRTSNPASDAVQSRRLDDGRTVAEMMADLVADLGERCIGRRGLSDVGAVVGATKAEDGAALRARMPRQIILAPGVGAQGGRIDDLAQMARPEGGGVLVTASRSILYPPDADADWRAAIARAAAQTGRDAADVLGPTL